MVMAKCAHCHMPVDARDCARDWYQRPLCDYCSGDLKHENMLKKRYDES